jgi:uncharacterized protein YxjI
MKYLIRQKVFSFGDKFTIKNELSEDCYQVVGKVFSLGNKLSLYDMQGRELYFIQQKLMKLMPEYHLLKGEDIVAVVKKKLTFLKARFEIESSLGYYTIQGSPFGYNFQILKDNQVVATISKQFFSMTDAYGIDISNNEDQAMMIALVIVIDQVVHENNSGSVSFQN